MKKILALSLFATALSSTAVEPLFMRQPAISPDGSTIAFGYKGDIYTVPAKGGQATRLTTDPAYDESPFWSPDGTMIAFGSDRNGSTDVFVMPANGGTPRRLTTSAVNEIPTGWLDNGHVIFNANEMPSSEVIRGNFSTQAYTVALDGLSRPAMLYSLPMPALSVNRSDGRIVYHDKKGFENEFRKHERSSATSDIWLIDNGKFTCLTDFTGHDLNPQWDGDNSIIYLSEQDGTLNVWKMNADGSGKCQLTHFDKHPVRNLSRANDGTLAFSNNGLLYTLTPGSEPTPVAIEINTDDYDLDHKRRWLSSGADNTAFSADGDQVAFTLRGDLYITSTKYKTTRRITDTDGQERTSSFAPDGRTIYYDSERDGQWCIYASKIDADGEKTFPYATSLTEELIYRAPEGKPSQQPKVSPDGKKLAFLEDRVALQVIDLDTKQVTTALPGEYNYSYTDGDVSFTWNPDSKWLLADYIGIGGWNNKDIALVSADGKTVIDLTESGYTDGNAHWALDGRALIYESSKYGMRNHGSWGEQSDIMLMILDGDTWEKYCLTEEEAEILKKADEDKKKTEESEGKDSKSKKKDKAKKKDDVETPSKPFDLANRRYRTVRLTPGSTFIGDMILSADGTKLYYNAPATEGSYNLYERDLRKGETKLLASGISGGFETDSKTENIITLSGGGIKKITLADGKTENVQFDAYYDRHPSAEREYIYDHMLSQVRDKFYDANLHGVNWEELGENYRRFLPHINNNYDYADMLSEILGELNASHTGSGYRSPGADFQPSYLGAFFDPTWQGDGLKVREILPRGPLASPRDSLQPGDIVTAINGIAITPATDINSLLDGRAGRKTPITIRRANGSTLNTTVRPTSRGSLTGQLYTRWVERNQAIVDSLSDGRLAYVHIQGMDSPSFREVYSQLLGRYRNREAVIVDTRYNGGGWLHNDVALLLSGKEYVRFTPRGKYIGSEPFSQWTKPSVMLVNEANYSDAHGTPYTYKTLGIGDVIGAPVPGTMTAVWWETQIDPTLYFGIPQVTSLDRTGEALENKQLEPDVKILTNPADILAGRDEQLEGAVKHLLDKLDSNK